LARLHRTAEAINAYEEALRLQPAYPEAHNNLGNALLASGRATEAVAHYEEAIRLRPGFGEARSNLANALLQAGRAPEALQAGEEAVRLAPGDADARYNLGNALAAGGRLEAGRSEYEKAASMKPPCACNPVWPMPPTTLATCWSSLIICRRRWWLTSRPCGGIPVSRIRGAT
jgi:protein O-mannosyl-transferase